MKSHRRHELKTNALAQALGGGGLPQFWQRYGTKILIGVCAVLAIVLVLRYQRSTALELKQRTEDSFSAALIDLANLQNTARIADEKLASEQRRRTQDQVEASVQQVLDDSKDDALKADALVVRGDLNWMLATLPQLPGATTQPTTQKLEKSREEYLDTAKRAYEAAVKAPGVMPLAVVRARLALGSIAEQRRSWGDAKAAYDSLVADASTPEPFKKEAKLRLNDLERIQKPVLIGRPATRPSDSELKADPLGPEIPATTRASTAPTTAPTSETK